MNNRIQCDIDLGAVRHNLQCVYTYAPNANVIAVIKANAYGHGLLEIARTLGTQVHLGVVNLADALHLRAHGCQAPVVLMTGVYTAADLKLAQQHQLKLVVHHPAQIKLLQQAPSLNLESIWLKVNTGMNRLGFPYADAKQAQHQLSQISGIGQINIMSHLAAPDEPESKLTQLQLGRMHELQHLFNADFSFCNSAAIIQNLLPNATWLRPGIMLYGVSPIPNTTAADFGLKNAMTLKAPIISINTVRKGEHIGYDYSYQCPQDALIACLNIGYGQGYPRHAANGTPTLYQNQICPIVGRVSMDIITIDISKVAQPNTNELVTLWGDGLAIETVAQSATTIAYELLTQLNPNIKRHYRN